MECPEGMPYIQWNEIVLGLKSLLGFDILVGMASVKVSSNYQVVIPKEARKKLGLKKGQYLYVKSFDKDTVSLTTQSPVDKYYGALKGIWTEDAVKYTRRIRADRELPKL